MKRTLLISAVLVVVVVGGFVGVAAARPGWLPAWARIDLARLFGGGRAEVAAPAAGDAGLFCKEHGVPEKFCTLCHEELKESLLLCPEHGDIPEDICTLCHPEVEKKYNLEMCQEHGLPKHFCSLCGKGPSAALSLPDDGWCASHNLPEPLCPDCARDPRPIGPVPAGAAPRACRQPLPVVRLASARLVRQVGFQTAPVTEAEHAPRLVATAETAFDANRYAEISPRVDGFLREVRVDLGQVVRPGEVLAVVDSAEVGAARSQYLSAQAAITLARATHDRTRALTGQGALPAKQELEALTALNQAQAAGMVAEQKLRNLGCTDADLARILQARDTRSLLEVAAPIGGTVVLRQAVRGEAVRATSRLFAVADTTRMWLWVDVYEADIARVQPGQAVRFTISGADAPDCSGAVTWVGAEVDATTRTTRVRAELANPDGRLRARQFGTAEIRLGDDRKVLVIPRAAVQRKDDFHLVFLPHEGNSYRAQRIVARPIDRGDAVEVVWGLKPGQQVVTRGAFLLKTEIMKGAIGAGCCD